MTVLKVEVDSCEAEESFLQSSLNLHKELRDSIDSSWQTHPLSIFKQKLNQDSAGKTSSLPKSTREFYKKQNEFIRELESVHCLMANKDDPHSQERRLSKRQSLFNEIITITIFIGNLILVVLKVIASVWSGSLSVISSVLDSCVDLVSSIIIWIAARESNKFLPYTYPEGRNRIESVAILILSVIMCSASIQIVINSIQKITSMAIGQSNGPDMSNLAIIILSICILFKIIFIGLCFFLGKGDSNEALFVDQRNDCFTIILTIVFSVLSARVPSIPWLIYLDPVGAILIAFYIIYSWVILATNHVQNLVGKSADPQFIQKLCFICLNHDSRILRLDTIRAFHIGKCYFVEVDIVLKEDMPLHEAHDIGESLQNKLELLSDVERAFVHLDYEWVHHPNIEHKRT